MPVVCAVYGYMGHYRGQPDWAYEFPDWTGPDTQFCGTGPAEPDCIRTYIFIKFTYSDNSIKSTVLKPNRQYKASTAKMA